jgi:3-deoxy-D-manno-octulosonic-acid transferase
VRALYTLLWWLLLPLVFVRLVQRSRRQPAYLQHIGERFGFYSCNNVSLSSTLSRYAGEGADESLRDAHAKPLIWLHAVSVGETRATVSLVARLRTAYPDHQILLTHTTPTGRETSEQLYGDSVWRVYLPYDYPFAVRRFLRHFMPQLGILMETEIWFNLIHAAETAGVPMMLLNARLSEKSAVGYARVASLTRNALQNLSAIAAQTEDDAARLTKLGAEYVSVMGNLKYDIVPPQAMLELGASLREQFGAARRVLLAASTREGEEALLLDAWQSQNFPANRHGASMTPENERASASRLPDGATSHSTRLAKKVNQVAGYHPILPPVGEGENESLRDFQDNVLLVIVPRHPQRFDEVAQMLVRRCLRYQRRSENKQVAGDVQVVLGDSMGEMFAYYVAADLAFIGGSLLPFGGQNLIEACAVGTPVLIGPYSYNFAEAARLAVAAGAAVQVSDAQQLMRSAQGILADTDAMKSMSEQGVQFVAAHQGATDKAMVSIEKLLKTAR